jgi:hypothetical protein
MADKSLGHNVLDTPQFGRRHSQSGHARLCNVRQTRASMLWWYGIDGIRLEMQAKLATRHLGVALDGRLARATGPLHAACPILQAHIVQNRHDGRIWGLLVQHRAMNAHDPVSAMLSPSSAVGTSARQVWLFEEGSSDAHIVGGVSHFLRSPTSPIVLLPRIPGDPTILLACMANI